MKTVVHLIALIYSLISTALFCQFLKSLEKLQKGNCDALKVMLTGAP